MKLIERLHQFEQKVTSIKKESALTTEFADLAPYFLYGGYIKVHQIHQDYQVYIKTVEFYFHSEEDNGIHDFIVYHRNNRVFETTPYFPLMSLHAHNSGFDITFESESGKYRASALIRTYEIKDNNGSYYQWSTKEQMFIPSKNKKYCYNKQSTYLYGCMNGFTLDNENSIEWVDDPREFKSILGKPRKNVQQYESEHDFKAKNGTKCKREWSFTREDEV